MSSSLQEEQRMGSTPAYKCICCNREYQRKLFYDKHILLCHLIMTKSLADMKKEDEEHADTPTVRVLYEIILEMNAKMVKMEARLNECEKWTSSSKRKLNIVEWLNERYTPYPITYTSWFNTIKLNRHHLEMTFEMDYVLGLSSILQSLILSGAESELPGAALRRPQAELPGAALRRPQAELPDAALRRPQAELPDAALRRPQAELPAIKCFTQKENILYIYDNGKWDIMSNELFDRLIMTLSKKLIGEFFLWQNENEDKLDNDAFAITHARNLKKVMGGSVSIEILSLRVKKELYKYLKTNAI